MGILGSAEYVECSASDLIGQYVGQTGPKTQGKLTEALGRVLFVDEAYRFCDSHFGAEAVNELVDCLTKPKFMGKLVVILAGYTDQIDKLLQINPGLSSRFPEEVVFENMDPENCLDLLDREIKKQGIEITPPLNCISSAERQRALDMFVELSKLESWGNGRDVKNLARNICSDAFASDASGLAINIVDILQNLEEMSKSRKVRCETKKDVLISDMLHKLGTLPPPTQHAPKPSMNTASTIAKAKIMDAVRDKDVPHFNPEKSPGSSPQRDPGVSDETWQQLQRNISQEQITKRAEAMFIETQRREYDRQRQASEVKLHRIEELEKERKVNLANEKRRKEIENELLEEKRQIEAALQAKREAEEKLRKAMEEAEKKRRQELEIQKKIRDMGICPAGFRWISDGAGYRCGGGSHYLSNSQLGK